MPFLRPHFFLLSRRQNFRKHHANYISDLLTKMVSLPFFCVYPLKCSYLFIERRRSICCEYFLILDATLKLAEPNIYMGVPR